MIQIANKSDCCGCYACFGICPQQCIEMQFDYEGFWYPVVDIDACTDCGLCELSCPILKIQEVDNYESIAYACINNDTKIREQSSSGGLFTLIAERVICNNGVVFGAGFDDEFNVVHNWTDKVDGLDNFRGSKYVQSRIGDTYQRAEDFLKKGQQVLFSGTPCQIAGLKAYIGKDYESLICVDIICHGVPSPKVWQLYKQHMEKVFRAKTEKISFRNKNRGWKLFSVSFTFDNKTEYSRPLTKDAFMQGFLKNLYLRPSCYSCGFKSLKRLSDITLADFWGVQSILPEMDDDKGTSLVLVHSNKGKAILSSLAEKIIYKEADLNKAVASNLAAIKSPAYNPKRDRFFNEFDGSEDIYELITKYTRVNLARQVYIEARNIASRIKSKIINS